MRPAILLYMMRKHGCALVLFAVTACLLTWPLVRHVGTHLPLGTEGSATVPLFNLWTFLWNANRLQAGLVGYWQAPIFYPTAGTFALSEPQLPTGVAFALLLRLTENPALAYNLLLLLVLTLNGYAAYRLAPTGVSGLAAGVLAVGLPFAFNELGVFQLTVLFPAMVALMALRRFARNPSLSASMALGGWAALTFLMTGYYGVFLSVFLLVGGLMLVGRHHLTGGAVLSGVLGVCTAAAIAAPVLIQQARFTAGYTLAARTITRNSADLADYLPGQPLSPGLGLVLLAVMGLLAARGDRRWRLFCGVGVLLALGMSLGLTLSVGGWHPYRLLLDFYPGFDRLRSPFRLAAFVQIFLLCLAGYGLHALWRQREAGRVAAVGLVVLTTLVGTHRLPQRLTPYPSEALHSEWITWLVAEPEHSVIAMLPFPEDGRAASYEQTVVGMLQGLEHGQLQVNGYSGRFPPPYRALFDVRESLPVLLGRLCRTDVTHLAVDPGWLTEARQTALSQAGAERAFADNNRVIYRLDCSAGR